MSDAAQSAKLKTFLEKVHVEGMQARSPEVPPPKEEQWVTWQLRGDATAVRQMLNGGKTIKK